MVSPYCAVARVDLDAVHMIERVFTASPVMSAMRLVELSPQACAVVYAERGVVKWMKPSRSFPTYVEPGTKLEPGAIAYGFFDRGRMIESAVPMDARTWLGSSAKLSACTEIIEHAMVIPDPGWGGVLSVLWIPGWSAHGSAGSRREKHRRGAETT